jgi:hypothetical protein
MRNRSALASTLAAIVVTGLAADACGGSPTATPPVVVNTPPVIESLTIAAPRAEADIPIQVAAVIKDTESTPDKFTYTWGASPQTGTFGGTTTFVGNQALTTWQPPRGQTTPDLYTITLTVTEAYTSAGQAKQNSVSSNTTIHYNDSRRETIAIAEQFIRDFGNFAVSPEQCVRNFSTNGMCAAERQAELEQIENNRDEFQILGSTFPAPVTTINVTSMTGQVEGPCTFEDIPNEGPNKGKREFVSGTCLLTTVYENFRWYLCASNFNPPYKTELASLKNRVPGRIQVR